MESAERHALTALCGELPALRAECARLPEKKQQLLVRIEAEARARRPILGLLAELLGTTHSDALRSLAGGLPGLGPGHADEERFGCPDHTCDRICQPPPAGAVPRCQLTGQSMSRR